MKGYQVTQEKQSAKVEEDSHPKNDTEGLAHNFVKKLHILLRHLLVL